MDALRNFLKSRWGMALLAITLAPMAFLSMGGGIGGGGGTLPDQIVSIGKRSITLDELHNAMSNSREQLTGRGIDSSLIKEDVLQSEVLNDLIEQVLIEQQASKLGLAVSDDVITKMLVAQEGFQDENGNFSNDLFSHYLKRNNLTKDRLFNQFRVNMAIEQFTKNIKNTAIYPMTAIDKLIDVQSETRNLWIYRIPWQNFQQAVTVTDADIKAYYEQNQKSLKSIPMVDLDYIKLTASDIKLPEITDEELNAQFESYKKANDLREFSQILLEGENAEAKAKEVKSKLDAGDTFDDLVKEYGLNGNSGAIGRLNAEVFGADANTVLTTLETLKVGEVSIPIQTSYGYQIFTVTADNTDELTLDSVKDELTTRIQAEKRQELLNEKITAINELAADGYGIKDIGQQEEISVKRLTDYKKENNLSDLSQPAVIKSAFDEFAIQDQSVTTAIDVDDATVWVQPSNYRPTETLTLEQATAEITDVITKQRATDAALSEAEKLAKLIQSQKDISAQDVEFTAVGVVTRQIPELKDSEKRVAFSKTAPDAAQETANVLSQFTKTDIGASVVVTQATAEVNKPAVNDIQKQQEATAVRSVIGQEHFNDYLAYLKSISTVEVDQEKIDSAGKAL